MPNFTNREQQAQSEEFKELPPGPGNSGPWGGLQTELPLSLLSEYGVLGPITGLSSTQGVLFNRGIAQAFPALTQQAAFPINPTQQVFTFADFFNSNGARVQAVIGGSNLFQWDPVALTFTQITGPAITIPPLGNPPAWSVLNQKLCFTSKGNYQVMQFDGLGATYTLTNAAAPQAFALAEIALHLMAGNLAGGNSQVYQWSGVGDPTDWVSFSSGQNNVLVDLGPIYGIKKLGQYGFGFHPGGIIQIVPTGIGTAPFAFFPMSSASVGLAFPFTLDTFTYQGMECAAYVGPDNVYLFNQSTSIPIGDAPIEGTGRRKGAKSGILGDITGLAPGRNATGFIVRSVAASPYLSYWLTIDGGNTWIYNFNEDNWTRVGISTPGGTPDGSGGRFLLATGTQTVPLASDIIAFGTRGGGGGGSVFTMNSLSPSGGALTASLNSGELVFGDRRHKHTVKKVRVVCRDFGVCNYSLSLINEANQIQTQTFTLGTVGLTKSDQSIIVPIVMTGLRIRWQLSAVGGQPFSVLGVSPMYDTGGEQRGGSVDNN